MRLSKTVFHLLIGSSVLAILSAPTVLVAQTTSQQASSADETATTDIIVTAQRRAESAQSVTTI